VTWSDRRNLAGACVLQAVVAAALRVMPIAVVRHRAARLRAAARFCLAGSDDRVIWAIEATARRLPGLSTCLSRAVVAELTLAPSPAPARINIGIRRLQGGILQGHAWVARGNRIVVGGREADAYTPMLTLGDPLA
jgi:hypothetical protein